jgi:HK97 family phage major capsid protein
MALSLAQKEKVLANLLSSPTGRKKLAQSMQLPLRSRLDYMGVARKALLIEELPPGALPYYDKDPLVPAIVVAEQGTTPESVTTGTRFLVPLKEIASNPKIPFTQIKERRFSIIERAQDLARQEIQTVEDDGIFNAFEAATGVNENTNISVPASIGSLTRDALADAYAEVEKHDLRVARVFLNARDYGDIRKFGRDQLDPVHQQSLLDTGLMGQFWGAQLIVSRRVPVGTVYVCTAPDFLGVFPIRIDLTVVAADDPQNRMIGWSIFEQVGEAIHNPNGVVKITINRS